MIRGGAVLDGATPDLDLAARLLHDLARARAAFNPIDGLSTYSPSVATAFRAYGRGPRVGLLGGDVAKDVPCVEFDVTRAYTSFMAEIKQVPVFSSFDEVRPYDGGEVEPHAFYLVRVPVLDGVLFPQRYDFVPGATVTYASGCGIALELLGVARPCRLVETNGAAVLRALYEDEELPDRARKDVANICYGLANKGRNRKQVAACYLDEAEAKAVAGLRAALVEADEAFGNAAAVFHRDAGAVVGHGDGHLVVLLCGGHRDRGGFAIARAVFEGVVEQVGEGLREELAIAQNGEAGCRGTGQRTALFLGHRLIEFDDVGDEFAHVHRDEAAAGLAGLGPRDGEQRVEGVEQAVGLIHRVLERRAVFGLGAGAQRGLDARLDAGQRRLEIVRDRGQQRLAQAVALAAVNIFGGFLVTKRMLAMYKKKEKPAVKPTTK